MSKHDYEAFDSEALYPALALIRIPSDPQAGTMAPTSDDQLFGTGFFVKKQGMLVTVAHNLTVDGEPGGTPLPWVWVCCYNASDRDWTDLHRVDVEPSLIDARLDAAILQVKTRSVATILVGAEWSKGDEVVVLGFQEDLGKTKKSGFVARPMLCEIPRNWDVAPYDLADSDEPTLRLGLASRDQPLGEGMSGGPVLNCKGTRVIAVEKALDPALGHRPPELKATALRWFAGTMRKLLPPARRVDREPSRPASSRRLQLGITKNHIGILYFVNQSSGYETGLREKRTGDSEFMLQLQDLGRLSIANEQNFLRLITELEILGYLTRREERVVSTDTSEYTVFWDLTAAGKRLADERG